MAQQVIYVGSAPNDGLGDPIRTAYIKCNDNFSQLYSRAQINPPTTLVGAVGDQAGMYAYDSTYFYYCFANYDGSSTIWAELQQSGNISATEILNGTSSIAIAGPGANATVNIAGTSNVMVFHSTGANITGYLTNSGNITGGNILTGGKISAVGNITGNYILGNGSQLLGLPETYANSNVAAYLPTYSGDFTAGNISAAGNVLAQGIMSSQGNIITNGYFVGTFLGNVTGNFVVPGSNTQVIFNTEGNASATAGMTFDTAGPNLFTVLGTISSQGNTIAGNVRTGGLISATGNVTAGNVSTGGLVSATGTVTGSSLLGSVVSVTANITGGNLLTGGVISASGNINGNNIVTGILSTTGNIESTGAKIHTTGNIDVGGNISTTNLTGTGISVSANITGGNLLIDGVISAAGNITGNFILGNGSQLSGLPATYGNSNVSSFLAAFGSNTVSTTGNITVGNVLAGGLSLAGNVLSSLIVDSYIFSSGNVTTGANLLTQSGYVYAGGNVTGGNILTGGVVSAVGNIYTNSIVSSGNLNLSSTGGNATQVLGGGTFRLPSFSTTQLNAITGVPGDLVYNTSVNRVQAWQYDATNSFAWVSLSVSTYQ